MKLFFLDIETTGVRYWKNGIHQISGCIEIDGELKESFDFKVCPFKDAIIENDALATSHVTREQILNYPPMFDVYMNLSTLLSKYVDKYNKTDKFFLVGYNCASFDNQFLRAWFVQNGDNYFGSWFWSSTLDVMVLAAEYLKHRRHAMIDFKLKTVAAELGIDVDESRLHDGSYDIELTRRIYHLTTDIKRPTPEDYKTKETEDVLP
jgi:DNA polymerase-3 subunit epsilon